ncbi:unnamed protein product (mitochondrion) [Plasmodiophora brassicae]|uniref:Uncharacterized protein n=1 Tax=Plasmodiophora brassicae TaxID=37360 RepID=A0A0G4IPA6_PLABS|nr:hypothetical protein PBRA_005644 [Plasmodiophora brassicae]SPR01021.1 unnamed protein product [Plasmodiophora brassicae]
MSSGRVKIAVFLGVVSAFIGWRLCSPSTTASREDFYRLTQSNVASARVLIGYRVLCALTIAASVTWVAVDPVGLPGVVNLVDGSMAQIRSVGRIRFCTFTVWAWIGQGLYFACTLLLHLLGPDRSPMALVLIATVLFEIGFALALLVSFVVSYVLIPSSPDPTNLFSWASLAMHNLNVLFMVVELVLNQVEFHIEHFHFALLFGVVYILFAWVVAQRTGYFFYFFLNPNYKHALLAHALLLLTVTTFFGLSVLVSHSFNPEQSVLSLPVLTAVTVALCTIRPRPKNVTA